MIGLADVRDWLKGFAGAENYYIGTLDSKKPKSLGVYQRKPSGEAHIAIGGLDCTSYDIKQLSLLLHWNKNARETERKSGTAVSAAAAGRGCDNRRYQSLLHPPDGTGTGGCGAG